MNLAASIEWMKFAIETNLATQIVKNLCIFKSFVVIRSNE